MKELTFKVGDKVLYRSYVSNHFNELPTITKIEPNKITKTRFGVRTSDCTIDINGRVVDVKFSDIYIPNERTIRIFGKKKWDVKGVSQNNGYFGSFSKIELDGKKSDVYCDDRDAIVLVVTDWYDDIFALKWSGDYRWNDDKPCVVFDKEKGYALNEPHVNNVISEWCESIDTEWHYDNNIGNYLEGVKDGCDVYITKNGNIIKSEYANPKNYETILKMCKSMTNDEIVNLWIEKDFPCAYIRGMEYKGSKPIRINKEKANTLFQTHNSFNLPFNSAEWTILNGEVTLLMRDYANSDYD